MKTETAWHRTSATVVVAFCALILTGCSLDLRYDEDEMRRNDYLVGWIKKFGLIDQEQTWSVARAVRADVDPAAYGDGVTVYIYTSNPTNGGKLIGRASHATTLTLDVVDGTDMLFVQARDAVGHCYENSYYRVQNGRVVIDGHRGGSRAASDVTLGDTRVFAAGAAQQELREDYNPTNPYTLTEAIERNDKKYLWKKSVTAIDATQSHWLVTFVDIYGNEVELEFQYYMPFQNTGYKVYGGFTDTEIATIGCGVTHEANKRLLRPESPEVVYQLINGVETTHDKTVKVKDLAPLFGMGSHFEEQRDPSCLERWKDDFNPDVTFTVSGPLTLDFMYGATQNSNIFGYYYWREGQNPDEAVRYILIDNATPQHNIAINDPDNYLSGGMQLSGVMLNGNPEESDDILIGTSYKVPYFDADGVASYDFPTGTHVAFFLIVNGMENEAGWLGNTNLSVRSQNYDFGRTFTGYSRDGSGDKDPTKGEIDAISFQYGSQYYLGFEDRGGDKDMNDVVFFVTGNAKPREPYIKIDTDDVDEAESWIIACEDLGSTEDYDFNDIVFSVSHVAGSDIAEIVPLAAGGTLSAVIMYDGMPLNYVADNSEIHYLVSGRRYVDSYPMLNTQANEVAMAGRTIMINVPTDFSMARDLSKFSIEVSGRGVSYEVTVPDSGMAPQIMCLPGDWRWPIERVSITQAYPDFKDWTNDKDALGWLQNSKPQLLVRR